MLLKPDAVESLQKPLMQIAIPTSVKSMGAKYVLCMHLYCKITDAYGNVVKTVSATLTKG